MTIDGIVYHSFRATLRSPLIGNPNYCLGAYAPSEDLARENVARKLLRRILEVTGKEILDYNFYRVANLENKVDSLTSDNEKLKMENGHLKEQIKALNYIDNSM
ncbi:hypothetical protein SESBI_48170 [Sesbania bispinosa]|nr:hypothetical protein SESBI_48170 [Sesbania bispinosa]